MQFNRWITIVLALVLLITEVGWTPPPNCYMSSRTPTRGEWQPGVVAAFGGPHPHSGCGARAKLVNTTATVPWGETLPTVVRVNKLPNSTAYPAPKIILPVVSHQARRWRTVNQRCL